MKKIGLEGDVGIIHRSRGKPSNRSFPAELRKEVMNLYKNKYIGFGPTLGMEKLFEIEKIKISAETLRKWLIAEQLPYKRRKKRPHRQWRERRFYFGELIQVDGSGHFWFEDRGLKCVLMGYIDDATGNIFGRFYSYEGTIPAMDSFKRYIEKYGLPLSIYVDRHSTYKSTGKPSIEDELNNTKPLSEFERALKELRVNVIHAHSPQAKGRIERLFKTLQDRLVKEMRLRNINSIEEANKFLDKFLPAYNKRFSLKPKEVEDMHRGIPNDLNLDNMLCIKTKRTLRNDFTVAHNKKLYQIKDSIWGKKVIIEERIDGSMFIMYKDKKLTYEEIIARPAVVTESKHYAFVPKRIYRPPAGHPWRKSYINPYSRPKKYLTGNESKALLTNT